MDDRLLAEVLARLDAAALDGPVEELVLAACLDRLDETVGGAPLHRPDVEPAAMTDPVGAYLQRVTVQGFRGVGERRALPLDPGPGLTVVVGRNGSGKSSFAEAVEMVLTGQIDAGCRRARTCGGGRGATCTPRTRCASRWSWSRKGTRNRRR